MKRPALLIPVLLIIFIAVLLVNTLRLSSTQFKAPVGKAVAVNDSAIHRLSEAVRFKTISYDDRNNIDSAAFQQLKDFLVRKFPLCNQAMEKHPVGLSLVYQWKGTDTMQKPLLLLAHMDVVPAEGNWKEDPFSGTVKDGFINGRGTLDDKVSVLGMLEAAEMLLKENFRPARTIWFAFGHDEEVHGRSGAAHIAAWMKARRIAPEFVLDEGLVVTEGIVPGMEKPVALIGIAEKGNVIMKLSVKLKSGHASMPEKETAIGVLAAGLARIQDHPFDPTFTEPLQKFMTNIGPEMGPFKRVVFANPWLFKTFIVQAYQKTPSGNASIRTTVAPAILQAGVKENVIPDYAEAILNIRPLPGHSPEQVKKDIAEILNDERVQIELTAAIPASGVSSTGSRAYKILDTTIRQVFPEVVVAPSLMVAGTDSKHYVPLAENVYRFLPVRFTKEDLARIHGKDERISIKAYKDVIRFYYQLLLNAASSDH